MERRAVELDAGARELGRNHVVQLRLVLPAILRTEKVYCIENEHGYSSLRVSVYSNQIMTSVDRAADGLYRLMQTYGKPRKVQTTNYADWPELVELYDFLFERREK